MLLRARKVPMRWQTLPQPYDITIFYGWQEIRTHPSVIQTSYFM